MSYGPTIDSIEIQEPRNGETVNADVPIGNGICEGDVRARGIATRPKWRIATCKVLVRPYAASAPMTLPWRDVTESGEDAIVTAVVGEDGKFRWEIMCATVRCTGGNCQNSGENLIAVAVEWEQLDEMGMATREWEPSEGDGAIAANKFTAKCVFHKEVARDRRKEATYVNSFAKRVGTWATYRIDVNNGSVLVDSGTGHPLRAKKIACFVLTADWLIESNRWTAVGSPLGTVRLPRLTDRPRFANVFLGAVCVFQKEHVTTSPSPEAHPTLVTVIDSTSRLRPTIVTLDDRLDARVVINGRPSSILPHTGNVTVCVKVLE